MFRKTTYGSIAAALVVARLVTEAGGQIPININIVAGGIPGAPAAAAANNNPNPGNSCSCDCCQVANRQGSQQVNGIPVVCASQADPTLTNSDSTATCASTCDVDATNSIVTNQQQGTIDTSSFCMMNCLPMQNQLGSGCRKITAQEQAQLLTAGSYDPASILQPVTTQAPTQLQDPNAPPEPPQLVDQQTLAAAQAGPAPAPASAGDAAALAAAQAAADQKDKETGAMVAMASGKQAVAVGIEARVAEAEAVSANARAAATTDLDASKSNSLLVMTAQAQVKAAQVRAAIYAKSAAKAAERVKAELKEIQGLPEKAAQLAAAEAKKILCGESQEIADNLAFVKSRLAGPALPLPNAEAAVRAAQPYYNVMQTAIARGGLYEAAARKLQDEAQTLQEQSRALAGQAVQYQQGGYGGMAAKLMAQAKGMLTQAQAKDDQAQKDFAVAEAVQKQIPNYQANAAAASARATSISNPAGQPPPARAPAFLFQRSNRLRKVLAEPS